MLSLLTMHHFSLAFITLALVACGHGFHDKNIKLNKTHKKYKIRNSHGTFKVKPLKHLHLKETGVASYYGAECHGKLTASGAAFNMHHYTAAHKTAHLPSVALVTHGKQSRVVLINDRGPFVKGRILDCSHKLAHDLGFAHKGCGIVRLELLKRETMALRQNGGRIRWDGSKPFPMVTKKIAKVVHLHPKNSLC